MYTWLSKSKHVDQKDNILEKHCKHSYEAFGCQLKGFSYFYNLEVIAINRISDRENLKNKPCPSTLPFEWTTRISFDKSICSAPTISWSRRSGVHNFRPKWVLLWVDVLFELIDRFLKMRKGHSGITWERYLWNIIFRYIPS